MPWKLPGRPWALVRYRGPAEAWLRAHAGLVRVGSLLRAPVKSPRAFLYCFSLESEGRESIAVAKRPGRLILGFDRASPEGAVAAGDRVHGATGSARQPERCYPREGDALG